MPAPIRDDPDALKGPARTRRVAMPPVPKDLATALRWQAWIIQQTARKNLTAPESAAMTSALKEFRALLDVRDADAKLAEARNLVADMKALRSKP